MTRRKETAGHYPGGPKSRAVLNRDLLDTTPQYRAPSTWGNRTLDILLDDEAVLREAVAPLLALAHKRPLSPPAEEMTLRLLDSIYAVRRLRRAVEVAIGDERVLQEAQV
jgi:hypothetical protein